MAKRKVEIPTQLIDNLTDEEILDLLDLEYHHMSRLMLEPLNKPLVTTTRFTTIHKDIDYVSVQELREIRDRNLELAKELGIENLLNTLLSYHSKKTVIKKKIEDYENNIMSIHTLTLRDNFRIEKIFPIYEENNIKYTTQVIFDDEVVFIYHEKEVYDFDDKEYVSKTTIKRIVVNDWINVLKTIYVEYTDEVVTKNIISMFKNQYKTVENYRKIQKELMDDIRRGYNETN